ncbi:DUF4269 domain-containing protein [Dysgonomonas sp. GY617]|uniref:DUF4269 domain-containing protein n=1 Tax=Dysgonomonas sp. GY617 TaxID=2780420 RepID=UPI001883F9BA|nr:DUF4269 domain-containing protein [Dysgonomonas sp. GY617]MBF0577546.1 DUF4269 domain-containing protein [Dysgonomonas sp. GY617]
MNFRDIEYLKAGTDKQKLCYRILKEIKVLDVLYDYNPIAVGTIPIAIDVDESDIDIVCCAENLPEIRDVVRLHYSTYNMFSDKLRDVYVANFEHSGLPIEIYAESRPTLDQNGYRHMVVEDRIMKLAGDGFRQKIIRLKEQGYKTEPAFGKLLNLENPYSDLLEFELLTDEELKLLIKNKHVPE